MSANPDPAIITWQIADVEHHLNRALSDIVQHYALMLKQVCEELMARPRYRLTQVQRANIRGEYHRAKNIMLGVRVANMQLDDVGDRASKAFETLTDIALKIKRISGRAAKDVLDNF